MNETICIQVINGPNLNMLGQREPEVYGHLSYQEVIQYTESKCDQKVKLYWDQFNGETEIINKLHNIHQSKTPKYHGLIINPGAFSHTSIAILDALKILTIPIAEVHLSNTHQRETFRNSKLTAKSSTIIMEGLGREAYWLSALWIQNYLLKR